MTLTAEQIALRKTAITATDVAVLCHADPYRTEMHLWLDKTGRPLPPEDDDLDSLERREVGHDLEPVLRRIFSRRHGVEVKGPGATTLRSFPGVNIAATPDGIIEEWGSGWEGKTHSVGLRSMYGDEGTDEVPVREVFQCQTGMLVTGLRAWRLTCFIDNRARHYALSADDEMHSLIVEHAAKWWRDYVVADRPPPIEGSEAGHDLLARLYPTSGQLIRVAAEEERAVILALHRALTDSHIVESQVEQLKAQVKAMIGEDAGIRWSEDESAKITWKRSRDSRKTDWQRAAYDFATRVQLAGSHPALATFCQRPATADFPVEALRRLLEEIGAGIDVAGCTTTTPGSRRFCVPRSWGRGS